MQATETVSVTSFLPTTLAGWLALFLAISTAVGLVYGYAKSISHLNGLGGRVSDVEKKTTTLEARAGEFSEYMRQEARDKARLFEELGQTRQLALNATDAIRLARDEILARFAETDRAHIREINAVAMQISNMEAELRGAGTLPRKQS